MLVYWLYAVFVEMLHWGSYNSLFISVKSLELKRFFDMFIHFNPLDPAMHKKLVGRCLRCMSTHHFKCDDTYSSFRS